MTLLTIDLEPSEGFDLRAEVEHEDQPDLSFWGETSESWSDDRRRPSRPHPTSVVVSDGRWSVWATPTLDGCGGGPVDHGAEVKHRMGEGMTNTEAQADLDKLMRKCARHAAGLDISVYYVSVVASKAGVDLARESIGNVEVTDDCDEDAVLREVAQDIAPEAIDLARATLRDLCAA